MDYSLYRAAVCHRSRALLATSLEICQESRAAIETSKLRVARSRIEVARVRKTRLDLVIHRPTSRGRLAAA